MSAINPGPGVDLLALAQAIDNTGFRGVRVVNPATDAILADTGDLPAGLYLVSVQAGASAPLAARLQRRSADDAVLTNISFIRLAADSPLSYRTLVALLVNEELEVVAHNALTGDVLLGLQWARLKT